jgi:hypothetical protein
MLIVTAVSCKRRINIRDQFKKSLNRRKTKSGQAAESNIKKYKYEEVLQFLMPHIHERSTISSIEQPPENGSDTVNSQVMASADETREEISASNWAADIHQPETPRKKRKIVPTETASSVLMKYKIENNEKQNGYKHPIDAFLEGLAPTLKNLPLYYQYLAAADSQSSAAMEVRLEHCVALNVYKGKHRFYTKHRRKSDRSFFMRFKHDNHCKYMKNVRATHPVLS